MYSLKNLLNNYAVTLTDKANVNPVFICQRFCALALVKELGVDEDRTGNHSNYVSATKFTYNFANDHETFSKEKFNITLDSNSRELPKFHKNHLNCDSLLLLPGVQLNRCQMM